MAIFGSSLFGVGEDVRPRCRGKSGTQELLAWPVLRIRCIRKERGRWGFTTEETDGLGDWAEIVELLVSCKTEVLLRHQAGETGPWVEMMACHLKPV
jgi:hypothetical protein